MVEISVVIPVFDCESCIPALYDRLKKSLNGIGVTYEIVFVEDGGRDGSWSVIEKLASADPTVRAFQLSRNFGQHAAITAGLSEAAGNWAVVMDCDLQDPPEDIPRLYSKAREGFDIVFTLRESRQHSFFKRIASYGYFRALKAFTKTDVNSRMGGFSIISRQVIDAFVRVKDVNRHYLLVLHWLGFKTTAIEYEHAERHSGKSSYDFRRLFKHAIVGMFFQTTVLLEWIVYFGFLISFLGLLESLYLVFQYFQYSVYPGWTSLSVLILLTTGFILVSTGITGLYIGRVFEQVKDRLLFVIRRRVERQVAQ